MNENLLGKSIGDKEPNGTLWESTRDYLAYLPSEVEDAAYRCVLVHWFNQEIVNVLQGTGRRKQLGRSVQQQVESDAQSLYDALQTLPFVEDYPGKGHNFHDLTRETMLDHMWREEREFYQAVSTQAANYFGRSLGSEEGADWSDVIEYIYHYVIANEAEAFDQIPQFLNSLQVTGQVSKLHALVQVVEEQAQAGRISAENAPLVRYWRLEATIMAGNYHRAIQIANELRSASDGTVTPEIRAKAIIRLADSLQAVERYDEALDSYQEALSKYEQMEYLEGTVEALIGLGDTSLTRNDVHRAQGFFTDALERYLTTRLLSVTDEEGTEGELAPERAQSQSVTLRVLDPRAWHAPSSETQQGNGAASSAEQKDGTEDSTEEIVIYGIEVEPTAESTKKEDGEEVIELWPVEISSTLADLWLKLGYVYNDTNDYDAAFACANLAGRMSSNLGDTYGVMRALKLLHNLGLATGDLDLRRSTIVDLQSLLPVARKQGDQATELNALLGLAADHTQLSDLKLARQYYSEASDLARQMNDMTAQAAALAGLANLDLEEGRKESAESRLQEALQLYTQAGYLGGQANTQLSLGDLELQRKRPALASWHYQAALDLFVGLKIPEGKTDSLRGLGLSSQAQAHYAEAVKYFEDAVAVARDTKIRSLEATSLTNLADAYGQRQDDQLARRTYQEALSIFHVIGQRADKAGTLVALGDLTLIQNEIDEAADMYRQAREIYADLKQPADEFSSMIGLLDVYRKRDNKLEYAHIIDQAVALAESMGDSAQQLRLLIRLVGRLRYHNDFRRLLGILKSALSLRPEDPLALFEQGEVLNDMAEYEAAVQVIDQAIQLDSSNSQGFASKGWALENLGSDRARESLLSYQKAIDLDPSDLWYHKGLANALRLLGESEAADSKYRWVIEQAEKRGIRNADILYLKGWCHYCVGQYDTAIDLLTESLARDPDQVSNQFDLALALISSGADAQARSAYQRAMEMATRTDELRRRGLLYVALADLKEAVDGKPEMAKLEAVQVTLNLIEMALRQTSESVSAIRFWN